VVLRGRGKGRRTGRRVGRRRSRRRDGRRDRRRGEGKGGRRGRGKHKRMGGGKGIRAWGGQQLSNGILLLIRWRLISRAERGKVLESGGGLEEDFAGFEAGLEANRTCSGEQEVQREGLVQR
jgi:hypothetical protein